MIKPETPTLDDESSIEEYFFGAVTVGERGQVVIPAAARKKCGMEPGDKLLAFYHPWGDGIMLVKVDQVHHIHQVMSWMLHQLGGVEAESKE